MSLTGGNPVLKALDKAKTQTYHFKAIVIAGMGFFTDAYDLFVISILTKLLGRLYYFDPSTPDTVGTLPVNVNAAVTGVALCGTLAGQLFFGWAGDRFGRKKVYGITLALMVIASLGQGLSMGSSATGVLATLCFFRFWLGFGIGGDYPLSATIMSEYSNTKTRGAFVAAVFAMQGVGILTGGAVAIIFSSIFKSAYPSPPWNAPNPSGVGTLGNASTVRQADWVWRLTLMFGAVPAALTYYSRSKMPETARYTALIERDQQQAAKDMARVLNTQFETSPEVIESARAAKSQQYGLFSSKFRQRHGWQLVGTCMTWFLLDVSFYSQNLFQGNLFTAVGWLPASKSMSALEEVFRLARAQALIALVSTVPGYWFTVAFIDIVGRKPIQLMGFTMMSIFMYILAFDFYNLRGGTIKGDSAHFTHGNHLAFIFLYALTFFFANFGPNATTFIVPAELFPARLRSTCHGISSATGKAGAIVGSFGFLYASQDSHQAAVQNGYSKGIGYKYSLLLLAICSTVGVFFTLLIPETKGRSLEDLSGEDEDQRELEDAAAGRVADSSKIEGTYV
ncbi:unnamed protein product [Calypogeia fissa]